MHKVNFFQNYQRPLVLILYGWIHLSQLRFHEQTPLFDEVCEETLGGTHLLYDSIFDNLYVGEIPLSGKPFFDCEGICEYFFDLFAVFLEEQDFEVDVEGGFDGDLFSVSSIDGAVSLEKVEYFGENSLSTFMRTGWPFVRSNEPKYAHNNIR